MEEAPSQMFNRVLNTPLIMAPIIKTKEIFKELFNFFCSQRVWKVSSFPTHIRNKNATHYTKEISEKFRKPPWKHFRRSPFYRFIHLIFCVPTKLMIPKKILRKEEW